MLATFVKAKTTTDFRPIANVRLLYQAFACLVLGRIESVLDANQPEEQHGFRKGVSAHLISILQELYAGQLGVARGDDGESCRLFQISGGVRQGFVLSPRLFLCRLAISNGLMET